MSPSDPENDTRFDRMVTWGKNHRLISVLLLVLTAAAAFAEQTEKLEKLFNFLTGTQQAAVSPAPASSLPPIVSPSVPSSVGSGGHSGLSITTKTAAEILDSIRSLKPYQQEAAGFAYSGITVSWTLNLESIPANSKRIIFSENSTNAKTFTLVGCDDVDIESNPAIKVASREDRFQVSGVISRADAYSVSLKQCTFLPPPAAADTSTSIVERHRTRGP